MSVPHRLLCAAALTVAVAVPAAASDADLPAGPIHDRHELMEEIGANAKKIGDAMKSGARDQVAAPARAIRDAAAKVLPLFPEGSLHPKSRALDTIWKDWVGYEKSNKEFEDAAAALVVAAESGSAELPQAVKRMFDSCKSCHEAFRAPEE